LLRPTLLIVAIRREILSVLATSHVMTVPTATAHVAASWTARRQRQGESPAAVGTTQALVCQVGADLLDELAVHPGAGDRTVTPSPRSSSRCASDIPSAEGSMSEYVTWEVCPRCGLLAALGWVNVGGIRGGLPQILPVEFDCPSGCRLGPDELAEAYGLAASGRTAEVDEKPNGQVRSRPDLPGV
jgi:hypothetical protein